MSKTVHFALHKFIILRLKCNYIAYIKLIFTNHSKHLTLTVIIIIIIIIINRDQKHPHGLDAYRRA